MLSIANTSILVLVYNKEIVQSETLNSIKELSNIQAQQCNLIIWNNGPQSLIAQDLTPFKNLGLNCKLIETLNNESLSKIYNQFIEQYPNDRFIILDDDSQLNSKFFIESQKIDQQHIGVPLIYSNGQLTGPKFKRQLCNTETIITNDHKFFGIGSGLVIGSQICQQLKQANGDIFDERFYFYGVDTTFFFRTREQKLNNKIQIISGFEHSLSKLKQESEEISEFRMKEHSYDLALRVLFYKPKITAYFLLLKECLKTGLKKLRNKKRKTRVKYLLDGFIKKKHYKN